MKNFVLISISLLFFLLGNTFIVNANESFSSDTIKIINKGNKQAVLIIDKEGSIQFNADFD